MANWRSALLTVSLMCMLEVGSTIPPELYQVVAAIYCQLLQTSKEIRDGISAAGRAAMGLPAGGSGQSAQ